MGQDLKYGKITTEHGSIPEDEPVFVLRAQDALALFALDAYGETVWMACCTPGFRADVRSAVDSFRKWPKKKLPD